MDVSIRTVTSSSAFSDFPVTRETRTFSEDFLRATQRVGTAEEALNLGDLASADFIIMSNKDATNFVLVYNISGGTPFAKLRPGGAMVLPMFGTGLYVKADTAECLIEYLAFQD